MVSHWVGISENVGNFMTFKGLTNDTLMIIHHSNICLVHDLGSKNFHLEPLNEEPPVVIKLLWKISQGFSFTLPVHGETTAPLHNSNDDADDSTMAIINLEDLVDHTFLMDECKDGQ